MEMTQKWLQQTGSDQMSAHFCQLAWASWVQAAHEYKLLAGAASPGGTPTRAVPNHQTRAREHRPVQHVRQLLFFWERQFLWHYKLWPFQWHCSTQKNAKTKTNGCTSCLLAAQLELPIKIGRLDSSAHTTLHKENARDREGQSDV